MKTWMTTKTAGLPRWAWVSLASGAVILGLYLRSRMDKAETESESTASGAEPMPEGLSQYAGSEAGAGLAGVGLYGGTAGQVVPVQSPYIPEGFTDIFASVTSLASELGAALAEQHVSEIENKPGQTETTPSPLTGGGAPILGGNHQPVTTNEIARLEKEINALQAEIKSLTDKIQQYKNQYAPLSKHPKAAQQVQQWEAQRAKDQGEVQYKQSKLAALKAIKKAAA